MAVPMTGSAPSSGCRRMINRSVDEPVVGGADGFVHASETRAVSKMRAASRWARSTTPLATDAWSYTVTDNEVDSASKAMQGAASPNARTVHAASRNWPPIHPLRAHRGACPHGEMRERLAKG